MLKKIQLILLCFFGLGICVGCSNESSSNRSGSLFSKQILTVAVDKDPLSLDPRLVRDVYGATVMHMLFEGLMRTNIHGILEPAIAESVMISEDQKTYTFTLRQTQWSDGTSLTAHDFERSWMSMLAPSFPAPNANLLYAIKGAKSFKEGGISADEVGIHATAKNILVVELNQPTPYFLELTSYHFYFPVPPNPDKQTLTAFVSNGPFKLDNWQLHNSFKSVKNPSYWDAVHVVLSEITFQILDDHTALQLFKSGKIDWAGSTSALIPQDAIESLRMQGILQVTQASGTHFLRFNTFKSPFNNEKFRRALSLSIDRQAIVEHITQGNQLAAVGIVPPTFGLQNQNYFSDHDIVEANILLKIALEDIGPLPPMTLSYSTNERSHKIAQAIQQQWKQALGIHISLESIEFKVFLDRVKNGAYQIGMGSWYADFFDPINFLEVFKFKNTSANQTFWENSQYAKLLDAYTIEKSAEERKKLLGTAESILIQEMPIAPLYYGSFNYVKNPKLHDVVVNSLGFLDFKQAYFKE